MSEVKYEIVKQIGVLSKSSSGWVKTPSALTGTSPKYDKENLNANPRLDGRIWGRPGRGPDREKMGKGVTLSKEELSALKELLNGMEG